MVESVIAQSYSEWELIMVDDGSSDGTLEMLHEYAEKDIRIKVIVRDGVLKGGNVCRNIGLDNSEGEYVVFLDSDDWVPGYCIGNRVEFMEAHKDIDFAVFPGLKYVNSEFSSGNDLFGVKVSKDDFRMFVMRNLPFTVHSNIYRRDALVNRGCRWDERLMSLQDADFNIQNIHAGLKYAYASSSKPDYFLRMNGNTGSVSKVARTSKHKDSHFYYLEKLSNTIKGKYSIPFLFCVQSLFLIIGTASSDISSYRRFFAGRSMLWMLFAMKSGLFNLIANHFPQTGRIAGWIAFPAYFGYAKMMEFKRARIYRAHYMLETDMTNTLDKILL